MTGAQRLRLVLALGLVNLVLASVALGIGFQNTPTAPIAVVPPPTAQAHLARAGDPDHRTRHVHADPRRGRIRWPGEDPGAVHGRGAVGVGRAPAIRQRGAHAERRADAQHPRGDA